MEQLEDRSMMAVATISATDSTVDEQNLGTGAFTVTLDAPANGDTTVNLSFAGAASSSDYLLSF